MNFEFAGSMPNRGANGGREAGYTMVMFVMVIAIMSIAMGVAVQTAEFQMKREREAELIFRGQQYIEAIRLFKTKYGRYPMKLKELYEAKPRVIRKTWKDPITDSENWGIIFLGQEGQRRGQQGRQLAGPGAGGRQRGRGVRAIGTQTPFDGGQTSDTGATGGQSEIDPVTGLPRSSFGQAGAERKMGPIVGVHSTSCDDAVKIFEGHTTYCEWKFVYREERQQGQGAAGPRQPPVGWHPGDKLDRDENGRIITSPGGSNEPGGGTGPPGPVATVPSP